MSQPAVANEFCLGRGTLPFLLCKKNSKTRTWEMGSQPSVAKDDL